MTEMFQRKKNRLALPARFSTSPVCSVVAPLSAALAFLLTNALTLTNTLVLGLEAFF